MSNRCCYNCGFTLLEMMIIVSLIALLAAIAIPAFISARKRSQNASFVSNLRIATHAFEMYSMEIGGYPPDANHGVIPDGMNDYLRRINWVGNTPIGGQWDWDPDTTGSGKGVRVVGITDDERMEEIDKVLDDGELSSGIFRKISDSDGYIYIIE